jgi:hypothetical protein
VNEEKAALHERGLADHELIADEEREDFSGTSAVTGDPGEPDVGRGGSAPRADNPE